MKKTNCIMDSCAPPRDMGSPWANYLPHVFGGRGAGSGRA